MFALALVVGKAFLQTKSMKMENIQYLVEMVCEVILISIILTENA